ncbi:MAG: hypothetical protein NWF06_09230 [Candidatus Bathyarchaeota archaeon]|nr:hypothetical protein [Candidatus Bathyarchaeum sp.]
MKQQLMYLIDLSRIQGNGDFLCPKCGVTISPDDETEDTYCIVNTKVRNNELVELTIQCQKCRSKIRVIGFSILDVVAK